MNPEPPSESTLRFWRRAFFVSIGMIVIPPLFGMAGTVIGMVRSFNELSTTGGSDPEMLSQNIFASLWSTAIGLSISGVGLIFFIVCLIRYLTLRKHRAQTT